MKKAKGLRKRWYMLRDLLGIPSKKYNYKNNYTKDKVINDNKDIYTLINELGIEIKRIQKKMSMPDSIIELKNNTKLFLPNYPSDWIQQQIADNNKFYEEELLMDLDQYLDKNSVIFDIGANIGNHVVYWGKITNVKRIHAFEPINSVFKTLEENIKINQLEDKVQLNMVGIGDKNCNASIGKNVWGCENTYQIENLGITRLEEDGIGDIPVISLDSYINSENFNDNKIDFLKIDVEGLEYEVIDGAKECLQKYKPKIFIESFDNVFPKMNALLEKLNYKKVRDFKNCNYLYEYRKN